MRHRSLPTSPRRPARKFRRILSKRKKHTKTDTVVSSTLKGLADTRVGTFTQALDDEATKASGFIGYATGAGLAATSIRLKDEIRGDRQLIESAALP